MALTNFAASSVKEPLLLSISQILYERKREGKRSDLVGLFRSFSYFFLFFNYCGHTYISRRMIMSHNFCTNSTCLDWNVCVFSCYVDLRVCMSCLNLHVSHGSFAFHWKFLEKTRKSANNFIWYWWQGIIELDTFLKNMMNCN